jgi:hypothetical protein
MIPNLRIIIDSFKKTMKGSTSELFSERNEMATELKKCSFCGMPSSDFIRQNNDSRICDDCFDMCKALVDNSCPIAAGADGPSRGKKVKNRFACVFCGSDEYVKGIQNQPGILICDGCIDHEPEKLQTPQTAENRSKKSETEKSAPAIKLAGIDELDFEQMSRVMTALVKKHTRLFSYGDTQYPVIDSAGFFQGLKDLGVDKEPVIKKGIGVEYARVESVKYDFECASMQMDEDGYYNIKSHITSVDIHLLPDRSKRKYIKPDGNFSKK